ncbi:unnamed protein product [Brugia timori]|uniref:Uncharacterized protein n=1 Tax=Brugia timori TaxID=42155 RepID=A0A0R3QYR4_9BILA|nr:unnamed protein product [Brugia timori]
MRDCVGCTHMELVFPEFRTHSRMNNKIGLVFLLFFFLKKLWFNKTRTYLGRIKWHEII